MLSAKLKEAAGNGLASTLYVDDVFSTWLYTGNGSTQTITNGIDLAGQGGMTWIKSRSAATDHKLTDTVRGATKALISDTTGAQTTDANGLTAFSSTGFSIGTDSVYNTNAATYASWTFRKAAKFFDVVTYTGDGSATLKVNHSLGVTPGMVIVKRIDSAANWVVATRKSDTILSFSYLNSDGAEVGSTGYYPSSTAYVSPTTFGPGYFKYGGVTVAETNDIGGAYVAYLFAHDTAADGIIQCGSFIGGTSVSVSLGWEPQWLLVKKVNGAQNWFVMDSMRGLNANQGDRALSPNLASAEPTASSNFNITATGFVNVGLGSSADTFIYMVIRRPNKPPTSGTQVYYPVARSGTGATGSSTSFGQVTDLVFTKQRGSTQTWAWTDRLRGATKELSSATTTVETAYANDLTGFDIMTGFYFGSGASGQMNTSGSTYDDHLFRRAPGFFDVVCYTGTGSATTQAHELTVVPELIIVKERSAANDWWVYNATVGNTKYSVLNSTAIPVTSSTAWNNTTPTSSVFSIGTGANVNASTQTYVAYLFATLAGISKVGSYTGNGSTQTINCGFTGGARFVLIKRTDSTGDWYVFDTTRGMTTLTDPYLLLNSTAAEVATLGAVTSVTTGFAVNAAIVAAINTNAASYIFLAIA